MKTRSYLIGAAGLALAGALALLVLFGSNAADNPGRKATARTVGPSAPPMYASTTEQRRAKFNNWAADQWTFSSPAAASARLPYRLRTPSYTGGRRLAAVYVSTQSDPRMRAAILVFDDPIEGVRLEARTPGVPADYDALVAELVAAKKSGINKADTVPRLVTVNGHPGYGTDPGYNVWGETKLPRPSHLAWTDGEVEYKMYGAPGEQGTSLAELLKVAESMY